MHKLKILGSGGYFQNEQRHTACYLLNNNMVLDAGSGFLRIMEEPMAEDVHVLLSHIHLDHVCGLVHLYGVKEKIKSNIKVYCSKEEIDFLKNNLFSSRLFDPACDFLQFEEIKPEMEIDGIPIKCVPQIHGKYGSRGFIFDKFLAYYTDTQIRKKLERPVSLLLHEAYSLRKDTSSHCSVESVYKLFCGSGCKQLGLIHINPNFSNIDENLMWIMTDGINRFVAEDNLEIEVDNI